MSIEFIIVDRKSNRPKVLKDINTLTEEQFETHDVYSTKQITGDDFEKFKQQMMIAQLQEQQKKIAEQLAQLTGVPVGPVSRAPTASVSPVDNPTDATPANPNSSELPRNPNDYTAIMNVKTNQYFTKRELEKEWVELKLAAEKIPEVVMVEMHNDKFIIEVTEHVPNLPKRSELGIPLVQRVE